MVVFFFYGGGVGVGRVGVEFFVLLIVVCCEISDDLFVGWIVYGRKNVKLLFISSYCGLYFVLLIRKLEIM